jgi:hypothetical protein
MDPGSCVSGPPSRWSENTQVAATACVYCCWLGSSTKTRSFVTRRSTLPEMVASEAVLDAGLELPRVRAAVGAGLRADAVALAGGPLAGVAVAAVEAVDAVALAEAEAVPAAVPAAARAALDAVPVVLAVHPIALVLALAEEVVDAAAAAPPPVELPLVAVPVAVELHALPHGCRLIPLLPVAVVPDEPLHGGLRERGLAPVPGAAEPRDGEERGHGGGRQEGGVEAAALAQEEHGEREEEQREPRPEPVVGLAEQGQRLLVVGLRVVEGVERRRGPHGRGPQQRRRGPRQLTCPTSTAVHSSQPSRLLLIPSQSAPFLGTAELPAQMRWMRRGVVEKPWKRWKKRGGGTGGRLL